MLIEIRFTSASNVRNNINVALEPLTEFASSALGTGGSVSSMNLA
jgi:hypothetical protein